MFQVVDKKGLVRVSDLTEEKADAIVADFEHTLPQLGYRKVEQPAKKPSAYGQALIKTIQSS